MKKLLPPSLLLLCLIGMLVLHWPCPIKHFWDLPLNLLGIIPLGLGFVLSVQAEKQFRSVKANVNTFDAPSMLVTEGFYKYSRNPMYLGMALILFGVWLICGSISSLAGVVIFILMTDRWYIAFEEQRLGEMFGQEYEAYRDRVRRWL
jgi:protein-S-isoprenylcysteine O-methyltransferase Ste14